MYIGSFCYLLYARSIGGYKLDENKNRMRSLGKNLTFQQIDWFLLLTRTTCCVSSMKTEIENTSNQQKQKYVTND